jgi:hypothetical protein
MQKHANAPTPAGVESGTITVLVVPTDVSVPMHVKEVGADYDDYRWFVPSGSLQSIQGRGWEGWVDENGIGLRPPTNPRATVIGRSLQQDGYGTLALSMFGQPGPLLGPAVFCSPYDDDSDTYGSVPEFVLEAARLVGPVA